MNCMCMLSIAAYLLYLAFAIPICEFDAVERACQVTLSDYRCSLGQTAPHVLLFDVHPRWVGIALCTSSYGHDGVKRTHRSFERQIHLSKFTSCGICLRVATTNLKQSISYCDAVSDFCLGQASVLGAAAQRTKRTGTKSVCASWAWLLEPHYLHEDLS